MYIDINVMLHNLIETQAVQKNIPDRLVVTEQEIRAKPDRKNIKREYT